jgi:GT2 family glycosyltransferase
MRVWRSPQVIIKTVTFRAPPSSNRTETKFKQTEEDGFRTRKITFIRNDENYGYAEGNNVGIRFALKRGSDAVVLLNNDTVVHPEFLTKLVKASESRKTAGFFGPKIYYCDSSGRKDVISFAAGKLSLLTGKGRALGKHEIDVGQYDAIREVDYLEGSCLFVKTQVIDEIGLLDPVFFAYFEDYDWCVRGKNHGYASVYVPTAAYHRKQGLLPAFFAIFAADKRHPMGGACFFTNQKRFLVM